MSRHKIVKNMDLDDELDDFDGGEDYEEETDELTDEDRGMPLHTPPLTSEYHRNTLDLELPRKNARKLLIPGNFIEQLRLGTTEVRNILGSSLNISDKDIQDSLWHTYYDVEKTVAYLLNVHTPKTPKKEKKLDFGTSYDAIISSSISTRSYIPTDFWSDMAWLDTPIERHAILIAPILPIGRLLGGSSGGAPKMSKLQALAAARKKKAAEQKSSTAEDVEKPMANLDINSRNSPDNVKAAEIYEPKTTMPRRTYPSQKRKNSEPHPRTSQPSEPAEMEAPAEIAVNQPPVPEIEQAAPSAFANAMFSSNTCKPSSTLFTLPYLASQKLQDTSTDAFAGPSPDDVVIAAQSKAASLKTKANGEKKGPPKTNGEKKADQIANGVENMKIDNTPRATSKGLDVLQEYKKAKGKNAANFVVIGHVDAGKSTLMGRLLYDLKVVDQRTIDKFRSEAEKMGKSSFALAWVMDQGTEERSRGVTIDIATNKFETSKTAFTILDAPGHRDFIPNMIAGAAQADFAVLVVDASTGSFESGLKGQTKEHALLVRSMGVQRLIIAINKLDTVSWSQDRFDEISQQVSAFLLNAGFQQRNISFIPMSGLHGDNIVRKIDSPDASWYQGLTLVEELDRAEPVARALDKPLRFTIGDIFRGGVQNPLSVSGRIEAGSLQTGDALLAQPANQKAYIKSLEVDNEPVDWAVAGQNITINLSDIDPIHLKIGDVLCSPASPIVCLRKFEAKVLAFEYLIPGGIDVHRGRLHAAGRMSEALALLDKVTGVVTKRKPRVVKPGSVARVVIELDGLVPLEKGMRVVLRSGGDTIAAGLLE